MNHIFDENSLHVYRMAPKDTNTPFDYEKEDVEMSEQGEVYRERPMHPSEIDETVDCGLSFIDKLAISRNMLKNRIDSSDFGISFEEAKWLTYSALGATTVAVCSIILEQG